MTKKVTRKESRQRARVLALLDELDAKHGPVDAAARARAERKLRRILT